MKANVQKKKITGNGFLLLITIALFVVMYVAGTVSYTHLTLPTILRV